MAGTIKDMRDESPTLLPAVSADGREALRYLESQPAIDQEQIRLVRDCTARVVGPIPIRIVRLVRGKETRSASAARAKSGRACPPGQRLRAVEQHHFQHVAIAEAVERLRLAHLGAHIERVVAGQAVGAEADVDAVLAQLFIGNGAWPK